MTTIGKVIRIHGNTGVEVFEIASLLQDFLNTANPDDVRKLLTAVKKKPSVLKTALKFV